MNASLPSQPFALLPASAATRQVLELWLRLCNEFRQRERREILERDPSSQQVARYREELKWMIRGARAILSIVSDPDFPESQFPAEIAGKLHQLESSWKSLNNPMSEEQADKFIQKYFPDES